VDAKFELIDRGGYIPTGYKFDPVILNAKLPLEFFEARNALRIAQSAGAERYASSSYEKAVSQMNEADALASGKHENKKTLVALSRETVQTAEDAREIAVKHMTKNAPKASATREPAVKPTPRPVPMRNRSAASAPKPPPPMPKPTLDTSRVK